jgi:hypothetical protein
MVAQQADKTYKFECDGLCGEVIYTEMKSFVQARNLSQVDGWEHRRSPSGGWLNYCPRCRDESDPAAELAGLHIFTRSESD